MQMRLSLEAVKIWKLVPPPFFFLRVLKWECLEDVRCTVITREKVNMENQLKVSCDWNKCDAPASNRVDFADRVFSTLDRGQPVDHRNLCLFHTGEVRRTYMEYYERPLVSSFRAAAAG